MFILLLTGEDPTIKGPAMLLDRKTNSYSICVTNFTLVFFFRHKNYTTESENCGTSLQLMSSFSKFPADGQMNHSHSGLLE